MTTYTFAREVLFKGQDEARQLVYGVVLEPDSEDTQGDVITADEIEKAAHTFLLDSRIVGDSHRKNQADTIIQADAGVVESFISPVDFQMDGETIRKGSWVVAVKVHDPEMWAAIQKGEYGGFSIGGFGERVPAT